MLITFAEGNTITQLLNTKTQITPPQSLSITIAMNNSQLLKIEQMQLQHTH